MMQLQGHISYIHLIQKNYQLKNIYNIFLILKFWSKKTVKNLIGFWSQFLLILVIFGLPKSGQNPRKTPSKKHSKKSLKNHRKKCQNRPPK